MEDIVIDYIKGKCTPELFDTVFRAIFLINEFEADDPTENIVDLLQTEQDLSHEDLFDQVLASVVKSIDFIIGNHQIRLNPEVSLRQKVDLLNGLYELGKRENYDDIESELNTFNDDLIQFATIMTMVSPLEMTEVLTLVEFIDPKFLSVLKKHIEDVSSEETTEFAKKQKVIFENLAIFQLCFKNNFVDTLIDHGILVGGDFSLYLSYVGDHLVVDSDEETALNILALLMMSEDGSQNPLEIYREYSEKILHQLQRISKVETLLMHYYGQFIEFRKVFHEKNRLSKASNQA